MQDGTTVKEPSEVHDVRIPIPGVDSALRNVFFMLA